MEYAGKRCLLFEKDIWQKHKDNSKFALYGIDRDEPLERVKAFASQTKITYPLGLDPGADILPVMRRETPELPVMS